MVCDLSYPTEFIKDIFFMKKDKAFSILAYHLLFIFLIKLCRMILLQSHSMKKNLLLLIVSALSFSSLRSQVAVVENAKKYLYYERYGKAIETLSAFLQNPKLKESEQELAMFYLGRAYLLNNNLVDAKKTYQNALKVIPASALNMVGLGSVLLLEGNINEAQTLFDNAILQTKSKDIAVYTALAYAYTKAKAIDAKYAQNKFSLMHEKAKKHPEYHIAMGDFYKRLKYGNEVYTNYQLALSMESNNAPAKFRLGKLFLNQNNKEEFVQQMIDVTMLDKNFAPAFYELYRHYYNTDITKAKDYFLKYKALIEPTPALEFEEANVLYASKSFQKSLEQTLGMIDKYKDKVDVRCYRLGGYTLTQLNDTVQAVKYFETFFQKADIDIIDLDNYRFMAILLSRFPDKIKDAITYYEKAYVADTIPNSRVNDIRSIVSLYKKTKNTKMLAYWSGMLYNNNPKQNATDLFNWGYANLVAEEYASADTIFSTYIAKYPNEYFGYFWKGRTKSITDTTLASAIPYYQKTIEITSLDTAKNKNILVQSYGVLYAYNRNVLKNYDESLKVINALLLFKPNDADLLRDRDGIVKYIESVKTAEAKKAKK